MLEHVSGLRETAWAIALAVARSERGATMAEWGLVVGLIAIVSIGAISEVGDAVIGRFLQFASLF